MATILFDNTNTDTVLDGPPQPTLFGLAQPTFITRIFLYFFNSHHGADPAMVVYLRQVPEATPTTAPGAGSPEIFFGPFATVLSDGQGHAPNANVEVFPNIAVPAGRYEVVPTQPAKWSYNARSDNRGFAQIDGSVIPQLPVPASNQYERANWAVSRAQPQRVLWFQPVGGVGAASYVAIYRITNSESSTLVRITTPNGSFTLQPGASVDLSAQQIDIESMGLPAWGTYQDLCCTLGVLQAPAALKDPFLWTFNGPASERTGQG